MKLLWPMIISLFLSTALLAKEEIRQDWDGEGTIVLENDGSGKAIEIKLPFEKFKKGETLEFKVLSGKFQYLSIEYAQKLNETGEVKLFNFTGFEPPENAVVSSMPMKKVEFFNQNVRKKTDIGEREYFLFILNGDSDRLADTAGKIEMKFRPVTHAEKKTLGNTLFAIYLALLMFLLYKQSKKFKFKFNEMVMNREISNKHIIFKMALWTIAMFFAIVFATYVFPGLIGYAFPGLLDKTASNIGLVGLLFIGRAGWVAYSHFKTVRVCRCSQCRYFGETIFLGTTDHSKTTTSTYNQAGTLLSKNVQESWNEVRECPECHHRWKVGSNE